MFLTDSTRFPVIPAMLLFSKLGRWVNWSQHFGTKLGLHDKVNHTVERCQHGKHHVVHPFSVSRLQCFPGLGHWDVVASSAQCSHSGDLWAIAEHIMVVELHKHHSPICVHLNSVNQLGFYRKALLGSDQNRFEWTFGFQDWAGYWRGKMFQFLPATCKAPITMLKV